MVPIKDLYEILYSKNMNLTELICMTDAINNNIIRKEDQKDTKTLILKLKKFLNERSE